MRYQFGEFELDTAQFSLTHQGQKVGIEPKIFDLLVYLVANPGRLIQRQELMDNLWPKSVVTEASLNTAIRNARRALGEDGSSPSLIKTVRGRGYLFNHSASPRENSKLPGFATSSHNPGSRSVAVLPFQNFSPDPNQAYFAEGISEDITTELSRFKDLAVISRHSAFQFGGASQDVTKVGTELGADYLLEGSVRRRGDEFRINAQLIDTGTTAHVWAERYDFQLPDIFDIENKIIECVASMVSQSIQTVESDRARARSCSELGAYDHFLVGISYHKAIQVDRSNFLRAQEHFRAAVELDSSLIRAQVWLLCAEASSWTEVTPEIITAHIDRARQCLKLDPDESETHRILAALHLTAGNYDESGFHFNRAQSLNPNDALVCIKAALFNACLQQHERAFELVERAMRLNPKHAGWYWQVLGFAEFTAGRYHHSVNALRNNWEADPYCHSLLAASYQAMGETEAARQTAAKAMRSNPAGTIGMYTFVARHRDLIAHETLVKHMRAAGIPD